MKHALVLAIFVTNISLAARVADNEKSLPKKANVVGYWEGALHVGAVDVRLGFKIEQKDGVLTATMDSIDQGARNIPVEKATFADGKLTFELVKLKISYTGQLSEDGKVVKGEWKQGGATFPLELKLIDKPSEVKRPQTPKKPYPYTEEELVFENKAANVKLAGTFTKPKGDGPFRAVILITGSGPQDRDETLFNHKPFLVIADHLTRKGIAVLRYDDRGVGKSTGKFSEATTADFASDVRAAVAFLKQRKDVKGIGLIGHSEGGVIAPMVAADSADVAFIVLLAGTGLPGDELLIMQGQALLIAAKADEKALKLQRDTQMKLFKLVREGADAKSIKAALDDMRKELPEDIQKKSSSEISSQLQQTEKSLTSPWIKWFLMHDPRTSLRKVKCPVLALNGDKDVQVPMKENLGEIEKALKEAGNMNVEIRKFAGLNHLFQTCTTGLPAEYGKIEETIAPAVLEAMSDWIAKQK